MIWRLGWFLNTLRFQIEKQLDESIFRNESYGNHKWNLLEYQVTRWSGSPIRYSGLLIVAWCLIFECLRNWAPYVSDLIPAGAPSFRFILDWRTTVIGGQLTMIGVIYPLVVGFVGLLLQNRSANRALWKVYSGYSGFMFVGLSGLALVGSIQICFLLRPWISYHVDVLFGLVSCLWLLFNVLLTAWFLWATFRFVAVNSRGELLLKFCINEAFVGDIRARLASILPLNAVQSGLLPQAIQGLEISTYRLSRDLEPKFVRRFRRPRYLQNIRFRLLSVAVRLWMRGAARCPEEKSLTLSVSFDSVPKKEWELVVAEGGTLDPIVKFLGWLSYSFSRHPRFNFRETAPFVSALFGNLEDALRDDDLRHFENAAEDIEHWHSEIAAALAFKNDNGDWDNWLLLGDGAFSGRTYSDELAREYYHIARFAIQKLRSSTRFFEIVCYLQPRVYGYSNKQLAGRAIVDLIDSHYHVWLALTEWKYGVHTAVADALPDQQYERALRVFVGSWENWAMRIRLDRRSSGSPDLVQAQLRHLTQTSKMIVAAVRKRDWIPAEWATDMLLYWFDNSNQDVPHSRYYWNMFPLVPELLNESRGSLVWEIILNESGSESGDALSLALLNTWLDVRITTAAYLLSDQSAEGFDELQSIISATLSEKRLRPSSEINHDIAPVRTGADVLVSYLRQRLCSHFAGPEYEGRISSMIRDFGVINEPEYVSGRMYSGWGGHDLGSLSDCFVAISIAHSSREWQLDSSVYDVLLSNLYSVENKRHLVQLTEAWAKPSDLAIQIAGKLVLADDFADCLQNHLVSSKRAVERLSSATRAQILASEIDNNRLLELAEIAAGDSFSNSRDSFPFCLFDRIIHRPDLDSGARQININNIDRYRLSTVQDPDQEIVDGDWIRSVIADNTKIKLTQHILDDIDYERLVVSEAKELIDLLVEQTEAMREQGLTPLCIIAIPEVRRLLEANIWKIAVPEEVLQRNIEKLDGFTDGYLCHIDDVEVYSIRSRTEAACIVISKECCSQISYKEFEAERFIDVQFDIAEGADTGTLSLEYALLPSFDSKPAYRYVIEE